MNISLQVCSLSQAKRLKELGIEQRSYLYHFKDGVFNEAWGDDYYSAYSVAELGVMLQGYVLPEYKQDYRLLPEKKHNWHICHSPNDYPACAEKEAEARAQFLIHLIEQKFLTSAEVNQRLLNS